MFSDNAIELEYNDLSLLFYRQRRLERIIETYIKEGNEIKITNYKTTILVSDNGNFLLQIKLYF